MVFDAGDGSAAYTTVPTIRPAGRNVRVEWQSDAPAGTVFQVYVDRRLAWSGTDRTATFLTPPQRVRIDVGSVDPGEGGVDYSASLPTDPEPSDHALLTWVGGSYLGDVAGYRVYGSAVAGGAVSYAAPLGYVPATVAGVDLSGFGVGGFGLGGFGSAASDYSWRSARLGTGTWTFAVTPVDAAGNEHASPGTVSVAVVAAPNPPAPFSDGTRLRYTYNSGTRVPTLTWNAAP